jgi:hypothetical protein
MILVFHRNLNFPLSRTTFEIIRFSCELKMTSWRVIRWRTLVRVVHIVGFWKGDPNSIMCSTAKFPLLWGFGGNLIDVMMISPLGGAMYFFINEFWICYRFPTSRPIA